MSGQDPATKKKPNKGIDVKKKFADLAGELSKIQKELDKTKDGNKKRGTKDLESGGLTNILDSLDILHVYHSHLCLVHKD